MHFHASWWEATRFLEPSPNQTPPKGDHRSPARMGSESDPRDSAAPAHGVKPQSSGTHGNPVGKVTVAPLKLTWKPKSWSPKGDSAMTGGQGGSQQPKRSFALRSNVHAPTGAVATVARCRADKGAPLSRAMVAAVDQQLTCHNRRNRMGQKPFSTADPVADAPSRP